MFHIFFDEHRSETPPNQMCVFDRIIVSHRCLSAAYNTRLIIISIGFDVESIFNQLDESS